QHCIEDCWRESEGRRPVRTSVSQESISHEVAGVGSRIRDDEELLRHLFRGNGERGCGQCAYRMSRQTHFSLAHDASYCPSLQGHPKQQKQVKPEYIHEVPIA